MKRLSRLRTYPFASLLPFVRPLALLGALLSLPVAAHAAGLNDTGITDCSNDTVVDNTSGIQADSGTHPRQDCRYGRDPAATAGMRKTGAGGKGFDFTKIANNGAALPASAVLGSAASDWACTRDNLTGLVWEVKTSSGLRSKNHSYTWYSSDSASNGGSAGTVSAGTCATIGRCDTEKFVADVNTPGLCGANNWRMPSKEELLSIVDYARTAPAIDPSYFPNTLASTYWSASAYAYNPNNAWYVYFETGVGNYNSKVNWYQVRLVRSRQ